MGDIYGLLRWLGLSEEISAVCRACWRTFDGEGRDAVLRRKGRIPGAVPDAALCGPNGAERLPYGKI